MEILLVLVTGTLCMACFYVGVKTGQSTARGETVELPEINPVRYREARIQAETARAEADRENERIKTILLNIDNYDGSAVGQREVPR